MCSHQTRPCVKTDAGQERGESPTNEKSGGGRYQGEQSADFSSRGKVAERKCGLCFEQGGSRVEEEK